jgi:hypothetical protein
LISNAKTVAAKTVVALTAIAAFGLCLTSLASAAPQRVHLGAFTAGTTNSGLAVDSSGDIYVADPSDSSVHKFDQDGNPVAFTALSGSNTINGSDAGPDPDKTPQNGFTLDANTQIAVDTTGGATDGQIYIPDTSHNVVNVFNPDGSYLTQISGSATPATGFSYPCGIALVGDTLYVGNAFSGEIDRFVRSGNPITDADFDDAITGLPFSTCGVAVDSGGNVYNAPNAFSQAATITKFAPSDFGTNAPTGTHVTDGAQAFAVNPDDDHLFADSGTSVSEFDSSGADAGVVFGSPFLTDSHGVLPLASGNVLVSNNGDTPQVHTFSAVLDLPVVTTGDATNVAANTATLNGTVDPDSLTITDCSFQYVDDAQFQVDGFASATSAPCVPATPAGADPVPVTADISGLNPDTTYHFRLTATTADGTVNGDANTFFFKTPVDPDAIALPATGVTETSAVIGGIVDPNGFPTTYYIEYADNPAFTDSTSLPPTQDANAGDGDDGVAVSAVASGLQPDTDYFFRIVANSTVGDDTSDVISFHTLGTAPPPPVCPNAQFRTGFSANLPDCRAYEKVSPNDKDSSDILNGLNLASRDGNAATYISFGAFGGSQGGGLVDQFYSHRDPDGWSLVALTPPQVPINNLAASQFQDFSNDLTTSVVSYFGGDPDVDGAAPGTNNLYRTTTAAPGGLELLSSGQQTPGPADFPPNPGYGAGSDDLSVIGFDLTAPTPVTVTSGPAGPTGVNNAYRADGTSLTLVSVLPNGDPAPQGGTIGGDTGSGEYNAVSNDGSRIFWSSGNDGINPVEVYLRSGGTTTDVSASQRGTPDPAGPQNKAYWYATPDGSRVYFSSAEKLTDDATAAVGNPDLYRYDVGSGDLTDLTTQDGDGAGIQGVVGISDDGDQVYFVATGDLADGATDGETNLYVSDGDTVSFIAGLAEGFTDSSNWNIQFASKTGRVTPDGRYLLFSTHRRNSSYESGAFQEFYRYDNSTGDTVCVSCNPRGGSASGDATLTGSPDSISLSGLPQSERFNLSADGSVFFASPERLVNDDTNGKTDVYEWKNGRPKLISTGLGLDNSTQFVDASPDGNNVFFLTRQQLVATDTDNNVDLYDARVNGGLASQNTGGPTPPCQGDDCKPPANNPPPGGNPGTSGVSGNGNVQGGSAKDCSSLDAQANSLSKKAKQLSAKAKKASGKKKANLQKKAKKTRKKANNARAQANQCKGQS